MNDRPRSKASGKRSTKPMFTPGRIATIGASVASFAAMVPAMGPIVGNMSRPGHPVGADADADGAETTPPGAPVVVIDTDPAAPTAQDTTGTTPPPRSSASG